MSQTNARRAAALAAALLCFAVGMLAGVEASGGRISDILMVRTRTVAGPRTTVVRTHTATATPPAVTVIRTITRNADRHHRRHGHHPGG